MGGLSHDDGDDEETPYPPPADPPARGEFTLWVRARAAADDPQRRRPWSAARWWAILTLVGIVALEAVWIIALQIVAAAGGQ